MTITLSILDQDGAILAQDAGEVSTFLVYEKDYAPGDCVKVTVSEPGCLVDLCLDTAMPTTTLFFGEDCFCFPLPLGRQSAAYSDCAFASQRKRLTARLCPTDGTNQYRNLAHNPYDHSDNQTVFPHAHATAETRGEACFAARCAIDGEIASNHHGVWPYTSWGINSDPNAALTIEFGRKVVVDRLQIAIRADFPHDAWWREATVTTSGGESLPVLLKKTAQIQAISIASCEVEWLRLEKLIKADDPSPFPALTQLEVWGRDA